MMRSRRFIPFVFTGLLALIALALFLTACLQYETLKPLLSAFTSDGNFNSLKPENTVVFKTLFAVGGLITLALAALTGFQRWTRIGSFFRTLWGDMVIFFRFLIPSKKDWGFLAAVFLITVMAVIYRLEFIYSSLHHDEAYTFMAFAHSLWSAVTDYHLPNNHVFHSILVYLSTQLFGIQPWSVRLPAFSAGVLLSPAVYALGKRFYDHWIGLAAALLVALSPALIGYSDNARGYTLVALFTLLLLNLGGFVFIMKNTFAWVLITFISALGMYTVPVMLFPFGILYVWLFLENWVKSPSSYRSRWDFFNYWFISGFGTAFLTLLFYTPILVYSGPQKLFGNAFVTPLPWNALFVTLAHRFNDTWVEWTFRVPLLVIIFLSIGLVLSLIFHRRLSIQRIPLQLAAFLWIITLLIIQRPDAWSKVWVFLLPLLLLWATAGLVGPLRLIKYRNIPLGTVVVILGIGWGIWHAAWLEPQLTHLWLAHGAEERAVIYIKSVHAAGDKIVVAPPDDAPVWYYAELHDIPNLVYGRDASFDHLFVLVDPAEEQTLETVIKARGPALETVNLASCQLMDTFGKMQVYECTHK
jgi:hypothetical protein